MLNSRCFPTVSRTKEGLECRAAAPESIAGVRRSLGAAVESPPRLSQPCSRFREGLALSEKE